MGIFDFLNFFLVAPGGFQILLEFRGPVIRFLHLGFSGLAVFNFNVSLLFKRCDLFSGGGVITLNVQDGGVTVKGVFLARVFTQGFKFNFGQFVFHGIFVFRQGKISP